MSYICFITAVYHDSSMTCKPYVRQSVATDFICFTDNEHINDCGWLIDTYPYHDKENAVKFYKQSFNKIPILHKYDVIVWIDASIEIIWCKVSEYIMDHIHKNKIICWQHTKRSNISDEVYATHRLQKYSRNGNDIVMQYQAYLAEGFDSKFAVWLTCFIAFLQKDLEELLDDWYQQTLKYTDQDKLSFSYVCYKHDVSPLTLPNSKIYGIPHSSTQFYIKHEAI